MTARQAAGYCQVEVVESDRLCSAGSSSMRNNWGEQREGCCCGFPSEMLGDGDGERVDGKRSWSWSRVCA
jgi:hypothetical protein